MASDKDRGERLYEITNTLDSYIGVEVSGVVNVGDEESPELERADNDDAAEFFSVYLLHANTGMAECVGDFATRERAQAYADVLDELTTPSDEMCMRKLLQKMLADCNALSWHDYIRDVLGTTTTVLR